MRTSRQVQDRASKAAEPLLLLGTPALEPMPEDCRECRRFLAVASGWASANCWMAACRALREAASLYRCRVKQNNLQSPFTAPSGRSFPATHFPSSLRISLRSFTLAVVTFPAKRFSVSETCEDQAHRKNFTSQTAIQQEREREHMVGKRGTEFSEALFNPRFLNLHTPDISGWTLLCRAGCLHTLQGFEQRSWPLPTGHQEQHPILLLQL